MSRRRSRTINMPAPYLRRVWLEPLRVPNRDDYPFCLPILGDAFEMEFERAITIIVGENGTGKSTILEGIAVLAGYEAVFRGAGYEPGIVLSSTLATLSTVEARIPTLLVKADGPFITMAIVDANEVLLYRTLDTPTSSTDVAEAVYPSIVFYEDTYSSKLQRILVAGTVSLSEIASALHSQTGIQPEGVDFNVPVGEPLSGEPLSRSSIAGIAGALVS